MEIRTLNIDQLVPADYNPRKKLKPGDAEYEKLKRSLQEFGYVDPVIWNERTGHVIGGHQRLQVLIDSGETEVQVSVVDLDEDQEKALNIALNKISGEWDMAALAELLDELKWTDLDLALTGFDADEVDELFRKMQTTDDVQEDDFDTDAAVAAITEPVTKRGDIWQLGRHRLMCGDSTMIDDVDKLMDGKKADMVFTDPPYGMSAVSKSGVLKDKYKTDILNDGDNSVAIMAFELCQQMFGQSNQVWWGANYYSECLPSSECWLVWDKNNGGSDQTDCELAWANFRSVVRKFTMASEKKNRVHPTQKPIRLIADIVNKFDKQNTFKNVLDVFGGSGSTLIACEQLNRICYMMELDEKYVDVIIKRWEEFTGQKAELIS